ncbi:leucyl/phenylalanyl-tRNA--protein transferase [Pontiella sp.]|uniref:leucyl/phenylalanyl-tRNA--protein transferase n=1 Tax=Pontiella sp. TaxID=2837462 RepID=UPI003568DCBC
MGERYKRFVERVQNSPRLNHWFEIAVEAQVFYQSKLFRPPPYGRFPPIWMGYKKPFYGLLAYGGELTPETLLYAYSKGIYPFYETPPIEWCSCDPRMVLFLEKMKLKKGLRPLIKSGKYKVTFDTAFEQVVRACGTGDDREGCTWIIPERIEVALELHRRGQNHSIEVWNEAGELVGGLFGMDMGKLFISESAFHREPNAGKVAVAYLNCHLQHWGYVLNDIQWFWEHFRRMGYEDIPRKQYLRLIKTLVTEPTRIGTWSVDESLDVGNWIPSQPGSQVKAASLIYSRIRF